MGRGAIIGESHAYYLRSARILLASRTHITCESHAYYLRVARILLASRTHITCKSHVFGDSSRDCFWACPGASIAAVLRAIPELASHQSEVPPTGLFHRPPAVSCRTGFAHRPLAVSCRTGLFHRLPAASCRTGFAHSCRPLAAARDSRSGAGGELLEATRRVGKKQAPKLVERAEKGQRG